MQINKFFHKKNTLTVKLLKLQFSYEGVQTSPKIMNHNILV